MILSNPIKVSIGATTYTLQVATIARKQGGVLRPHVEVWDAKDTALHVQDVALGDRAEVAAFIAEAIRRVTDLNESDLDQALAALSPCVTDALAPRKPLPRPHDEADNRPWFDATDGDLKAGAHGAWAALQETNTPPTLFAFGDSGVARIVLGDDGPTTNVLDVNGLKYEIAERTRPSRLNATTREREIINPPLPYVTHMLSAPRPPCRSCYGWSKRLRSLQTALSRSNLATTRPRGRTTSRRRVCRSVRYLSAPRREK